jgi:hypothetical protein
MDHAVSYLNKRWTCCYLPEKGLEMPLIKCKGGCAVPPVYMLLFTCDLAEPIVIKPFHPKEGVWEGTEKVLSSCSINLPNLAYSYKHFCPSYKHFHFVHRVHSKPLYFERDFTSLFCVHISTFSLEPLSNWAGVHRLSYKYRSRSCRSNYFHSSAGVNPYISLKIKKRHYAYHMIEIHI